MRAFAEGKNRQALARLLIFFALAAVATTLYLISQGKYREILFPALNLGLIRGLMLIRERPFFAAHLERLLGGYLALQFLLSRGAFFSLEQPFHPLDFLLPFTLPGFHLSSAILGLPLTLLWLLSSGRHLLSVGLTEAPLNFAALIGQSAVSLVFLSLASSLRFRSHHQFQAQWRNENRRHRERLRLREELDAARRIQLSMLPHGDPKLSWLEVAGISIPASEVGGDYYDYLIPSERQLAVVVGDVSGHGVASGLLLSGIRSCLYLLQETPLAPDQILAKLDRMVRKTTGQRVLVTMVYGLFDQEQQQLVVSAAAHPPLLHYRAAEQRIEEVVFEALPLGTRIGSTLSLRQVAYAKGDVFLFSTDGVAEVSNLTGDFYGSERLTDCLFRNRQQPTAKLLRDAILNHIWSFKGDCQQTDDITLVVVRVR